MRLKALRNIGVIGFGLICILVVGAKAQKQKFEFSGKWVLNEEKSFGGGSGDRVYDEYVLTIVEKGFEFSIETKIIHKKKEVVAKRLYFTDKRGEMNLISFGKYKDVEMKSKTSRKGNSVRGRYEYNIESPKTKQRGLFSGTYKYELEKGGNRIIFITTSMDDFPGARSSSGQPSSSRGMTKWFFDKAQN